MRLLTHLMLAMTIVPLALTPGKHTLIVPSWGMTRSLTLPVEG